jgi:hypothetical protein
MSELVNRIVLVYVISLVVGFILGSAFNKSWIPLLFGMIATLFLIPTFIKMTTFERFKDKKEGFKEQVGSDNSINYDLVQGTQLEEVTTTANARNPFQNIMVDDYKYAPTRAAAPDITSTESKVELDSMFRTQWYSDPTDVFGKSQSQRMFITQPNTTVPNDQESYQNWLYKIPGKTCKEGNYDVCPAGTAGAVIPWLDGV